MPGNLDSRERTRQGVNMNLTNMKTTVMSNINLTRKFFISALVLLGLSASVSAQESSLKIAVLDVNGALLNSSAAQQIDSEILAETAEDREKLETLATEMQGLQQRVQRDEATLSDAEKKRIEDQFNELGVQYNYLAQKLQTLSQERMQQFQQAYTPALIQAIQEVVEQENYDLVLNRNAVLHYGSGTDITAKVIERLNQL